MRCALAVHVDVSDEQSTLDMAKAVHERWGRVDVLVNNAGIYYDLKQGDDTLEYLKFVLDVNMIGPWLCARAVFPYMKEQGGGKIINQSSGGAFVNGRPYGISKLALVSLTHGLARDLGEHRINVNAIAPGAIETEAALSLFPVGHPWRERMHELTPIRRAAQPTDLFGALLFLASSASDWVTGQCLNVDGGWIMRF